MYLLYLYYKENLCSPRNETSNNLIYTLNADHIHDTDPAKVGCLTEWIILWPISQIETETWSAFYTCLSKTLHM